MSIFCQDIIAGLAILCVALSPASAQYQSHRGDQSRLSPSNSYERGSRPQGAPSEDVMRIVVLGRSGSGVSSTIRELIGPQTPCEKPQGSTETLQNIYEYTISQIPGTNYQIKLIDMPGLVDGRTLEQDSQILATLKSYVSKTRVSPDFLLALSNFDDNRFAGIHSLFVRFLKRIELFKDEFLAKIFPPTMSNVFLLTRLMSSTKSEQRMPSGKINDFKSVIQNFSTYQPGYSVVVGDNHAKSDHDVNVESGYYLLPNGELYPKNIWEAMINSTTNRGLHEVLNAIRNNRETQMRCEAKLIQTNWNEYHSDADAFLYLLQQENWLVEETEVNLKIEDSFSRLPSISEKMKRIIQKTALQLYLQNENILQEENLPTTYPERAALFQKSSLTSSKYAAMLIEEAFNLQMPEYIESLTVGYGYDILADEMSLESPFKIDDFSPNPVGYQLPSFMKCRKLINPEVQAYTSYSDDVTGYFAERLEQLKFKTNENINVTNVKFSGKIKQGYNIPPEDGVEVATLTALKEHRTVQCLLSKKSEWGELQLNKEFEDTVNELTTVNLRSGDSINEWKIFFARYGTHIVVKGYGGGRMVGSMVGANVKNLFQSKSTIAQTLDSLLNFTPFPVPDLEQPLYSVFGGEAGQLNRQTRHLFNLPEGQRNRLLREWEESLNTKFDMLVNELSLDRISTVVKVKMGEDKGEMVDQALDLLLRGELKRQRGRVDIHTAKTNENGGSRGNTRNAQQMTTIPPPTTRSFNQAEHIPDEHDALVTQPTATPTVIPTVSRYANGGIHNHHRNHHEERTITSGAEHVSQPTSRTPSLTSAISSIDGREHMHSIPQASRRSICGNGIVEEGEQCDPIGPCCNHQCQFIIPHQTICKPETECSHRCAQCPFPIPKDDMTPCNDGTQVCKGGKCCGSICEKYGLQPCNLTRSTRNVDRRRVCKLACYDRNGRCRSVSDLNLNVLPDGFSLSTRPGEPCANFQRHHQDSFQDVEETTVVPRRDLGGGGSRQYSQGTQGMRVAQVAGPGNERPVEYTIQRNTVDRNQRDAQARDNNWQLSERELLDEQYVTEVCQTLKARYAARVVCHWNR